MVLCKLAHLADPPLSARCCGTERFSTAFSTAHVSISAQQAHAWRQADLEEGRNVFEEGNAFTMEAVQQQLDDLAAKHEAQVGSHVM